MSRRAHGEGTVTQRKDGTWMAQLSVGYDANGKRIRKTRYAKTQQKALARLNELKREFALGEVSDDRLTLAAYLQQWLSDKRRSVKTGTYEQYELAVHRHIVPRVGHVPLAKLTPLQVQTMLGSIADSIKKSAERSASRNPRRGTPKSPSLGQSVSARSGVSTANKCRIVLNNAYKQALKWQLVQRNPVDVVDSLPESGREMKLWEIDEATRFLDRARGHRLYALFYLAMSTGLRRAELLGLRWSDLEGEVLHVRNTLVKRNDGTLAPESPKSRSSRRTIPLASDIVQVLAEHRARQRAEREALGEAWRDTNLVFVSKVGTALNPDNLRRTLNALCAKAEVPRVRMHDLRHLHSSACIRDGMDPKMLAHRLGHSRASFTLDRYTHLFESARMASPASLSGLFDSQSQEKPN